MRLRAPERRLPAADGLLVAVAALLLALACESAGLGGTGTLLFFVGAASASAGWLRAVHARRRLPPQRGPARERAHR